MSGEEITAASEWIEIGNEFAAVQVRKVLTRNGARLEVRSPKRELSVLLDATVLDGLTWQTAESLSLMMKEPLEPLRPDSD
ncbi:MAG: dihydrodiol dehydrogenase [Actinobacteria bacterium]|nr:dihydrodiol dehydrogenase [Actinomycetota bacterium]